ncbi:MAG: aspartate aminotransferase family protein, partial [Leptospiraceae bacterium]|nr:aspartate aminotransferase family protein [Leptospiraceae bacterium]
TLSGNPVAMRAGLAQLQALQPDVYTHLNRLGEYLATGFNKRDFPWKIQQIHSIFWLHAGAEPPRRADRINRDAMQTYAQLHRHCLERGLYLAPSGYEVGFISAPMTETEVDQLLQTLVEFFEQR